MSDRYVVPKRKAPISIRTVRGREERVRIFLCDRAASHEGAEHPGDVFNGAAEFLAVENGSGEISLLRRSTIALALIEAGDAREVVPSADIVSDDDVCEPVSIEMEDGSRVAGMLRFQLPEGRRRLRDYLNLGPLFLVLQCGSRLVLVNKQCIVRVLPE